MNSGSTVSLLVLAALPFTAALLIAFVANENRRVASWIAGGFTLAGCAIVLLNAPAVFAGEVLHWSVEWLPELGLRFGFRLDGLAWLFAALITFIGALIVLYAAYYLSSKDPIARFFTFLMLFQGAMLGVTIADNLILLVVFWELTSLSSFLLIGYWHHRTDARLGARIALAITGGGGLALLGGAVLIGQIVGSYQLDDVLAAGDRIRAHEHYLIALFLVLAGAFTKSAQFPFHFWLPHAMAAPTPVSAYLHSATMVKAGVFLLARMYPALGASDAWFYTVTLVGLATLLIAAYIAIFQNDTKGLLAYSTVSHLGLITMLFGMDERIAIVAGIFHLINHATFKASLFMAAGIIDHESGTRDMRKLHGMLKYMPWTGALAIIASAAMAGVPLLNGFLSKEMFFAVAVEKEVSGSLRLLLPLGATLAAVFSTTYSARFIHDVFFNGEPRDLPRKPHEPPRFMRVPVELLVLLCLMVGIAPSVFVGPILEVGARGALNGAELPEYSLALWHGLNLPLLMSAIALGGGVALYIGIKRLVALHEATGLRWGGREIFVLLLDRTVRGARAVTLALQNGSLQRYLTLLVMVSVLAGLVPYLMAGVMPGADARPTLEGASWGFAVVWALSVLACVGTAIAHRRRLLALVLLGAVGLSVSLGFVYLSAPDLALTQLLVEVVTIVLMMLALHWLPREGLPEVHVARKWLDAGLAAIAGLGVTAIVYAVLSEPATRSMSPYFLENAVPAGGGSNVVNVILVDFRGYDTLGEITVLGIAGVIVYAALAGFAPKSRPLPFQTESDRHPLMLSLVSRLVLPLAILVSLYLFLRGHNEPGGGFIAGLVLATALIVQFVANGKRWVAERMRTDFRGWIGWGLLIAGLTGVGSWLFSAPFLTSTYFYPDLPLVGKIPVATAALFDLGVYLTVVGASMVALVTIAHLTGQPADAPAESSG
ncbi:MAG: monovalent cation/H+ antiporter subunit A [Burkholderiales bacterium]|nr:MAG: monovalent cation/H+ antiporter subunit A [Burkholderiales bacterium]